MMMYRLALYFAIVSSLVGAVGGVMELDDPDFNNPNYYVYENGTVHYAPGNEWYNDNNTGTHWFSGSNIHPIENNTIFTQEQIDAMQNQNVISEGSSTESGSYSFGVLSAMQILWSMGSGVLMIYPELDKVLRVEEIRYAADGQPYVVNLFQPFLVLIQIGIWAIYAVGIAQVLRNSNYRYNY